MRNKEAGRPPEGTPEFKEWLKKQTAKDAQEIMGDPLARPKFEERGPIFGDADDLGKTDAELFPDDIEEYTPDERKPRLVHNKDEKAGKSKNEK